MAGNGEESEKKSWLKAEALFQVGATLVLAPVVGYFIGAWIDGRSHTSWVKIAGLLLGIVAGFVQLIRIASAEGKK